MSFLPKARVVVPVDFSDGSADAVRTALEMASGPAAVHIVHVLLTNEQGGYYDEYKPSLAQLARCITRGFYYGSISPSAGSLTSFEYRSPSWRLPYILLAGVAFFDYAGVGANLQNLVYHPIVGLGLRSMLYEFDNNVFRLDFGFNLNDDGLSFLNAMQFGLSQTF